MLRYFLFPILLICHVTGQAQSQANWSRKQLIEPSSLAGAITDKADVVIISVGPGAIIPNSIDVGMASSKEGVDSLKTQLKTIAKEQKIIIYCGCCPFEHCPNIRPAIDALKHMNFTNYFLLNLPHNMKIDWIEQGYPVAK